MTWFHAAACLGTDVESFFPERRPPDPLALRVCRGCPVRRECLESAMEEEADSGRNRHGIRGGLSAPQRFQLYKCRTGTCNHKAQTEHDRTLRMAEVAP